MHALRRTLRPRRSALCLAAIAASALAGCSGDSSLSQATTASPVAVGSRSPGDTTPRSIQHGKAVLDGNFADPSQQWPTRAASIAKPFVNGGPPSLAVNGSNFVVGLNQTGSVSLIPSFGATTPLNLVNVAVSAIVLPSTLGPGDTVGVVCRAITGHAYVFAVGPTGGAGVLRWTIGSQGTPSRLLRSGTVAVPAQPDLSVEGDCVGGSQHSPTELVLALDGHVLGGVTDTQVPAPYFGLAGLHVSSARGATSATFSGFQVRTATAS